MSDATLRFSLPIRFMTDRGMTVYHRAVMMALLYYLSPNGPAHDPTMREIADAARCSVRKAEDVFADLMEWGYVQVEPTTTVNLFHPLRPAHTSALSIHYEIVGGGDI